MDHAPSSFSRRVPAAAIAFAGCGIATYLGLYQAGWLENVWEPFFGHGTAAILHSSVARALPVPDALLGAGAYLVESVLELLGDEARWRSRSVLTALNMMLVLAMGLAGLALVAAQGLVFHAWCTLCLLSASCSLAILALGADEIVAVSKHLLRRERT